MGRGRKPQGTVGVVVTTRGQGAPPLEPDVQVKPLAWGDGREREMYDRVEPCPQCYDPESKSNRGTYMYDENHGTICDLCCTHSQGWWLLSEHYAHAGEWCCKAGCGHTISEAEYLALIGASGGETKRRGRVSPLAS